MTKLACLLALLGLVAPAPAGAADFFVGSEDGWFWYEDPPLPAELPPVPETAEVPAPEPLPAASPAPPAAPEGPRFLSVAWIRENLDHYRDTAIDNPTPENVRAYLYLQKVMMDKASDFTAASQVVTMGDPLLDATAERPLSSFGVHAQDRAAYLARQSVLKELAGFTGLMFFFRSDCPHCHAMAPVVENLARRLGFAVVAVSVDGRPLGNGLFDDFRRDDGQAAILGVQTVPALFVARPPDRILPVGQGSMALETLEKRLLMIARQQGWVTEQAYDSTLAMQRQTQVPELGDVDQQLLGDPKAMVDYLRANMARGTQQ